MPPEPLANSSEPALDEAEATDLEQLIEQYSGEAVTSAGEIRQGTVISISEDGVVVDLGLKSEGLVPLSELSDVSGQALVQPGDTIDVLVESKELREGYLPVSAESAERRRVWDELERLYCEAAKVRLRVVERTKGGLLVQLDLSAIGPVRRPVHAFLPGSQVDLRPVRHWEGLLGRKLSGRIIRLNRRRGNIVLSRRLLLEEEQARRKKLLEEELKEGAVIKGTVKNITDYGVFVDLGGMDGLLHVSDLAWRRVSHPSEVVRVGDELMVKVLKLDPAKKRISLGLKQLQPDPWLQVPQKYAVGTRVRGRVVSLVDYGAFVELEPGVEGLIHISEMSWTQHVRRPAQVVNLGDWVEAVVLDLQPNEQRISLGLRQTEPDPFQDVIGRHPVGSTVRGRVRSLTEFGAFVEIEPGIEGLLHLSDLTWSKKVKRPEELLRRGEEIEVKVLKVDPVNRRLSLGLKQLQPDAWEQYLSRVHVGDVVRGRVSRKTNFGVFVELDDGVEGLCHVSELGEGEEGGAVEVGKQYEFKIVKVSLGERRIGLSLKAMASEHERRALEQYRASRPSATTTIGEILSQKSTSRERSGS
ncbi:MAG: 30S ribosomal protein S1 [Acidobacteria bacterium]|nr:30S ribosomal protein S1 [Acidobacteriota bacterium]